MSEPIAVRVTLLDTWDETVLQVPGSTLISDLKRTALARSRIRRPASEYLVKYKGAELSDSGTVAESGVGPNSSLIVLSRRRIPVR